MSIKLSLKTIIHKTQNIKIYLSKLLELQNAANENSFVNFHSLNYLEHNFLIFILYSFLHFHFIFPLFNPNNVRKTNQRNSKEQNKKIKIKTLKFLFLLYENFLPKARSNLRLINIISSLIFSLIFIYIN